ncbi:uncharacterized protein LOC110983315 isoform X2 [Acanthaster planci]|uniref:Uncharacterized protein LOC110983315 isoform X2 n=1 Tax=Acanthaster planci TaxID=133434 RepID=A0A8B7YXW7_ACAPL|nr:uncharacterized protein LOC110983315 isoform X2 [Acanthaster planci]
MTHVTQRQLKMAAELDQMPPRRKPFCRQTAVTNNVDVADGPIFAVQTSKTGPTRHFRQIKAPCNHFSHDGCSKETSNKDLQQMLPNSKASQKNSSQLQMIRDIHCNGLNHQYTCKGVGGTIQLFVKYIYSEHLTRYDQLLFKQRSSITISYHHETCTPITWQKEPEKAPKRKDISDGLPSSAGAVLADISHRKDLSDVYPRRPESSGQPLLESYPGGGSQGKSLQTSLRRSSNSLVDEQFDSGDSGRQLSSSTSSSLDTQELEASSSDRTIPKIEVNGVVKQSLSESGRHKGEGFRKSKKSSGYGTGGSDEIPEGQHFSSVFLSSENSVNEEIHHPGSYEDERRSFRLSHFSSEGGEHSSPGHNFKLSTGERKVQCQDSDLPPDAAIWLFKQGTHRKIPSHIAKIDIDNLSHSQCDRIFMEILQANPQIPIPRCECFDQSSLKKERYSEQVFTEEEENKRCARACTCIEAQLDFLEKMALISKSWANDMPADADQSRDPSEATASSGEQLELEFSAESEPSLCHSSIRGDDEIDGKTDAPCHTSSGTVTRQTPSYASAYLPGTNTSPSYLNNGTNCLRPSASASHFNKAGIEMDGSDRRYPQKNTHGMEGSRTGHQPLANGYLAAQNHREQLQAEASPLRGATGFTDHGITSGSSDARHMEQRAPFEEVVANGYAEPSHGKRSTGFKDHCVGCNTMHNGRISHTSYRMVSSQQPSNGCTNPVGRDYSSQLGDPERAVYCKKRCQDNRCQDSSCLLGKRQILKLGSLFLENRIKDGGHIMDCLWQHSSRCKEVECIVPFCAVFRRRPWLPFEEHFSQMCRGSISLDLQMELVNIMTKQLRLGDFLICPINPVSSELWKTACVVEGQFLGDFGDFNILRARIAFQDKARHDVVIKKALSHPDLKKLYFNINQKSSPYITQSYWCSDISGSEMLVCSTYYPEMESLHNAWMVQELTFDICLTLLQQVLYAAMHLHSTYKIVYLNWKCSNVLWDGRTTGENIKLCNFNKVVQIKPGCVVQCPANIIESFDPCFTAPEVFCRTPLSYNSDVWGIGCLLYEMLYKKSPYQDHTHLSPAEMRQLVRDDQIQPDLPCDNSQLLALLCDCLQRKMCERLTTEMFLEKVDDLLSAKTAEAER